MNNTKSNLTRVEIADTIYKELGIPRSESVIFVDQIVDQIINSLVTKKLRESLHTAHINLPVGIRSTIASEASHLL